MLAPFKRNSDAFHTNFNHYDDISVTLTKYLWFIKYNQIIIIELTDLKISFELLFDCNLEEWQATHCIFLFLTGEPINQFGPEDLNITCFV